MAMFLAAAPGVALHRPRVTPRSTQPTAFASSTPKPLAKAPRNRRVCAVATDVRTNPSCVASLGRRSKVVSGHGNCEFFPNSAAQWRGKRISARVMPAPSASASLQTPNTTTKMYGPRKNDPPLSKLSGAVGAAARISAFIMAALAVFLLRVKPSLAGAAKNVVEPAVETAVKADPTGAVVGTVVLLFVYGFFCISETAITTLWPWKVREISDQEGPDSPFTLLRKDITRFLTTILIGSTCSSIGSAALATEAALGLYGEAGVGYVTIALTLVTLVMCEIAPKSYAVQHATSVARLVIRPIAALSVLVYPLGKVCTAIVNAFFKLLNIQGSAEPFVSEEELKLVLSGAAKSGQVDVGEQEMIQNVLDMGETPVREVMTPLVKVVGVDRTANLQDLRTLYREHKYSRVPVYDDRIDNIVGVVNSMRMLDFENLDDASLISTKINQLPGFGDSPYFVPESMSVVKLMRELLARKTHMCIVVNEFGGTIGIATFEDCVEEIVGEIYDETDTPDEFEESEQFITEVSDNVFDVDYRCDVEDLADLVKVDIPSSALYDTVGGFTCDCFDHIPEVGESMVVTLPIKAGASWDEMDDEDEEGHGMSERNGSGNGHHALNNDSFSESLEQQKDPLDAGFGMCPVRLTVTDGDMKMVRSVRVRVGDAALEENAAESDAMLAGLNALQSYDDRGVSRVSLDDGDGVTVDIGADVGIEAEVTKQLPPR